MRYLVANEYRVSMDINAEISNDNVQAYSLLHEPAHYRCSMPGAESTDCYFEVDVEVQRKHPRECNKHQTSWTSARVRVLEYNLPVLAVPDYIATDQRKVFPEPFSVLLANMHACVQEIFSWWYCQWNHQVIIITCVLLLNLGTRVALFDVHYCWQLLSDSSYGFCFLAIKQGCASMNLAGLRLSLRMRKHRGVHKCIMCLIDSNDEIIIDIGCYTAHVWAFEAWERLQSAHYVQARDRHCLVYASHSSFCGKTESTLRQRSFMSSQCKYQIG